MYHCIMMYVYAHACGEELHDTCTGDRWSGYDWSTFCGRERLLDQRLHVVQPGPVEDVDVSIQLVVTVRRVRSSSFKPESWEGGDEGGIMNSRACIHSKSKTPTAMVQISK